MTPFNPEKVTITRKRFSTTQGEVLVEYDGTRIEQYGDHIAMDANGEYHGCDDATWMEVAEREAIKRGLARPALRKGDRVTLRGYEGTVVALPGEDPSLGHIPASMVGVAMASGRTLAAMDECEPVDSPFDDPDGQWQYVGGERGWTRTELTATGEQYVIPGCERNASPKAGQMDLFG